MEEELCGVVREGEGLVVVRMVIALCLCLGGE